jgi:DNA polymerase-3 subunit delta
MPVAQLPINPAPLNLLCSSEPLLIRDWLDSARQVLRDSGFEDIQNLATDSGLDWEELLAESDMMSLFADKKCRIITLSTGKPGKQGSKAIRALCDKIPDNDVFIFVVPVLDRNLKSSSWFKSIQAAGSIFELKPVYENQLAEWILQRARSKALNLDLQSAEFLAERTEGNLLAADQELEKLSIRFADHGVIDFKTIENSAAESSRYNHFVLVDACLSGKPDRALKILKSLQLEGYATVQLRWAIQASLEQLDRLKQVQQRGGLNDRIWQQHQVWRNKQRLYQNALSRLQASQIERLLQSCATLDRLGKGQQNSEFPDQDWCEIRTLIAEFSGLR